MSRTQNKPSLQLRKPRQTSARDAFIAGETVEPVMDTETSEHSNIQTFRRPDVQTSSTEAPPVPTTADTGSSKASRRRTTIYFEEETYKKLKVHCAMNDVEMSQTVSDALNAWLSQQNN